MKLSHRREVENRIPGQRASVTLTSWENEFSSESILKSTVNDFICGTKPCLVVMRLKSCDCDVVWL